ncbi:hypothetical protein ACQ4PT_025478 [Festuca glaucescens]
MEEWWLQVRKLAPEELRRDFDAVVALACLGFDSGRLAQLHSLNLQPDLLGEISSRLHDAADFVRFHAICKPWCESHELPARKKTTDQILPWLLACNKKHDHSLEFRFAFSKSTYLAPAPDSCTRKNWVASADGTAVRYLTAGLALHDPLTGDVTRLPPFIDGQWEEENPSGSIVHKDGTVLLYSKYMGGYDGTTKFRAALRRPGDDEWTVVQRTIESTYYGMFCIAYHSGKILVTIERKLWHVVTPSIDDEDVLVRMPSSMPLKYDGHYYEYDHVLESCGELLWASVHLRTDFWRGARDLSRALLVVVHALEEAPDPCWAPDQRWVLKKAISLANLVLFLGWPNSFSVEASRLGMNGGFAYFTWHCQNEYGVYRYNFIENTTELVECLPQGWHCERCTWLIPQPTIAPLHQGLPTTSRSNNMIRSKKRCCGP